MGLWLCHKHPNENMELRNTTCLLSRSKPFRVTRYTLFYFLFMNIIYICKEILNVLLKTSKTTYEGSQVQMLIILKKGGTSQIKNTKCKRIFKCPVSCTIEA